MGRISRRRIGALAVLALGIAALVLLLPPQLGGRTSYAIITGNSMEPELSAGDLVLMRARDAYAEGEIVGYRDPLIGQVVLHRIVDRVGGRFVTQGDNNDFRDPSRPVPEDVLGERWVAVPYLGSLVARVPRPWGAGVLALALVTLPFGRRRRWRGGHEPTPSDRVERPSHARVAPPLVSGVALLALLTLALLAFARSTEEPRALKSAYLETGAFSYRADVPAGAVYPEGVATTGDALFPRLVNRVRIAFRYDFTSPLPQDLEGTGVLHASVSDGAGWSRALPLDGGPARARDGGLTAVATLDVARLRHVVSAFERQAGVTNPSYTVAVAPTVEMKGRLGGEPVLTHFAPSLRFRLDASRLQLEDADAEPGADPLNPARHGDLVQPVPARISLLGVGMEVSSVRALAPLGVLVALGAFLATGRPLLRRLRDDEPFRIQLRHGGRIVTSAAPTARFAHRPVPVEDIEALARLSDRHDRPILAERLGARIRYSVEWDGLSYRYETVSSDGNGDGER
jgi:signal peptidase I